MVTQKIHDCSHKAETGQKTKKIVITQTLSYKSSPQISKAVNQHNIAGKTMKYLHKNDLI